MHTLFELPEDFNVYNAQDTLESLRMWLADSAPAEGCVLQLSAERVMEMDGSGLQLLASLRNSGYRLHIVNASSKFMDALATTGHPNWLSLGAAA